MFRTWGSLYEPSFATIASWVDELDEPSNATAGKYISRNKCFERSLGKIRSHLRTNNPSIPCFWLSNLCGKGG